MSLSIESYNIVISANERHDFLIMPKHLMYVRAELIQSVNSHSRRVQAGPFSRSATLTNALVSVVVGGSSLPMGSKFKVRNFTI